MQLKFSIPLSIRLVFLQFNITEFVTFNFFALLFFLTIPFLFKVEHQWLFLNAGVLGLIVFMTYGLTRWNTKFARIFRKWYIAAFLLVGFKETYILINEIYSRVCDHVLIKLDRLLLGVDPTVWLYQYANPLLTEFFQLSYFSYYFLPLIVLLSLYKKGSSEEFEYAVFVIIYGLYLSFLGYLLVPAVGPRFTLHQFEALNRELPGIFLTNVLREIINVVEMPRATDSHLFDTLYRDAFPSGHVQITAITLYLARKNRLKVFYLIFPLGISLIISTVYLRYHYVIDVIAGIGFMGFTIWSAPILKEWWARKSIQRNETPQSIDNGKTHEVMIKEKMTNEGR